MVTFIQFPSSFNSIDVDSLQLASLLHAINFTHLFVQLLQHLLADVGLADERHPLPQVPLPHGLHLGGVASLLAFLSLLLQTTGFSGGGGTQLLLLASVMMLFWSI